MRLGVQCLDGMAEAVRLRDFSRGLSACGLGRAAEGSPGLCGPGAAGDSRRIIETRFGNSSLYIF